MKILLIGKNGQVGYELQRSLQPLGEVLALDRRQFDLSDPAGMREVIRAARPEVIVNAAAYTAVDQAESEPQLALRINGDAPAVMAEEAARLGAALVHYSTDYVFSGSSSGDDTPWTESDRPDPRSVYGRTKLAGERAIQDAGVPHLILRTSWVYGMRGRNFLLTILRLAAEREELRIVSDQHGTPTWCRTIADSTAQMLAQCCASLDSRQWWQEKSGLYALTAQGQTTWHGFAQSILERASLPKKPALRAIATEDYPTPAQRPRYSVMSCTKLQQGFGLRMPHWSEALALCMG